MIKSVHERLSKSVLVPLGLKAAASATYVTIQEKSFGSRMKTLIISNKEMDDIMKIVKSLQKSSSLIKDVS